MGQEVPRKGGSAGWAKRGCVHCTGAGVGVGVGESCLSVLSVSVCFFWWSVISVGRVEAQSRDDVVGAFGSKAAAAQGPPSREPPRSEIKWTWLQVSPATGGASLGPVPTVQRHLAARTGSDWCLGLGPCWGPRLGHARSHPPIHPAALDAASTADDKNRYLPFSLRASV